jgi:hypothetical protein
MTTRNLDQASQAHQSQRLSPSDPRTLAPVELKPHPGLGDPRAKDPAMAGRVRLLGTAHRPPRRPLRALEPKCQELVVDDVGANLAVAPLDPVLDFGQVWIDELAPADPIVERPPPSPQTDVPATVLGEQPTSSLAARRLPVRSNASRNSTTSPACFTTSLLGSWDLSNPSEPGGTPLHLEGVQISWPPAGRLGDRERSARWPPAFRFPWPLSSPCQGTSGSGRPRSRDLDKRGHGTWTVAATRFGQSGKRSGRRRAAGVRPQSVNGGADEAVPSSRSGPTMRARDGDLTVDAGLLAGTRRRNDPTNCRWRHARASCVPIYCSRADSIGRGEVIGSAWR